MRNKPPDPTAKAEFLEHLRHMQRLLESAKFDHLRVEPVSAALASLGDSLDWRHWLSFESESRFFVEKQTLDLNTTTQTTSRNDESITIKKKDSELIGYASKPVDKNAVMRRSLSRNVSDINVTALARKKQFMKSLLERPSEHNKSEVVRPVAHSHIGRASPPKPKADPMPDSQFAKKRRNFRESEIPNNTISSENDSDEDPHEEARADAQDTRREAWNGMVNSISDLRETDMAPNRSSQFAEHSPKTHAEGSSLECKADKRQIFGQKQEHGESRLQTPEFGEFSYGNGFYSRPKQPNSSKILYKLYEEPERGFELKELVHANFANREGASKQSTERVHNGSEISGSEDAKEASCFVKRPEGV